MKRLLTLLFLLLPSLAWASPIYVYKGSGGVIRFSSKPPPNGVKAEVFTAKGNYSVVGRGGYRIGKLFTEKFTTLIASTARQHRVDPALVKAVIHAESAFNPKAVSRKGAMGLMQLMPATAKQHGVKKPFDPQDNINGGVKHLAMLLSRYHGDLKLVLAAYNAGVEAVKEYNGIPPYRETQDYVSKVMALKQRYSRAL